MRVVTIVGARPQFIKAAPVSRVLRSTSGMTEVLVHTGQHYDDGLSDVFFRELGIPKPDFHLEVGSGSHGRQTGSMLMRVEEVLLEQRPDRVLVYGDTNSTLAGALAAAKLHIPVAHVEAGLRSHNRRLPEEINRILTDHLADLLFTPTGGASENLRLEGIAEAKIHQVGDVMYDAALLYADLAQQQSSILERLGLASDGYVLATVHRAGNTDDPDRLSAIFAGLEHVARQLPVVLPLHPRTKAALAANPAVEGGIRGVRMIETVGYLDMIMLEKHARLIATDSGGVQKEAFFYRRPCVTLRDETEWVELVESGWNRICAPVDPDRIASTILSSVGRTGTVADFYGDGRAAQKLVDVMRSAS